MDKNELIYRIWLNRLPGLGDIYAEHLLDCFSSAQEIYEIKSIAQIPKGCEISNAAMMALIENKNLDYAKAMAEKIHKQNIGVLCYGCRDYPQMLKDIYAAPSILFYKGVNAFDGFSANISVVGKRKATPYGISATKAICDKLVRSGIGIISGLALGIDKAAHSAAIAANGQTIGVMGCGLDYVYPASHRGLYDDIVNSGGMILSEFTLDTPPISVNFPKRNRIISALGLGTLVVEAAPHSGSLITASYALEQNREVYAVPADISRPECGGTNGLIKQGAKLVTCAEDILEDLFYVLKHNLPETSIEDNKKALINDLSDEQKLVYSALLSGCRTSDGISEQTCLPIANINRNLSILELNGLIEMKTGLIYLNV